MNKYQCKPSTLGKLFRAYDKAEYELSQRRDIEFPAGTKVFFAGFETEVTPGSLYPHQINTKMGHMSWRNAKRVTDQGDR